MNKILVALCITFVSIQVTAQSKVFKEVTDDISSNLQPITQDGALMGYLAFTRLEQVSEDSFHYKITIMDENLNDIGVVPFTNEKMELQAVSFEQDVLCLAYLKSNLINTEFSNRKSYKKALAKSDPAIVLQFLSLEGKILQESSMKVTPVNSEKIYSSFGKFQVEVKLKHPIQLANILQKGFACSYGDETTNTLLAYSTSGQKIWKKNTTDSEGFVLVTTAEDIFMLSKQKNDYPEGGYSLTVYGVNEGSKHLSYKLKDRNQAPLKVLSFGKDLTTGKPFISGNIINADRGKKYLTGKNLATGAYAGVFTLNFNGHSKTDVKETFSYWLDGSQEPSISKRGRYAENEAYSRFATSVRDYEGNTYFVGSTFVRRVQWGTIAASVVLSPLIVVSPMLLANNGTLKFQVRDAMILKQNPQGILSFENVIDCNSSKFMAGKLPTVLYDTKRFYQVSNSNTKSNYIIVDDIKDIVIYNIGQKKIARKVAHKDGQVRTNVYPAKEGYVMFVEYNKKQKETKLSIEAL